MTMMPTMCVNGLYAEEKDQKNEQFSFEVDTRNAAHGDRR